MPSPNSGRSKPNPRSRRRGLGPNSGSRPNNALSLNSSPGNRVSPSNRSPGSRLSPNNSSPGNRLSPNNSSPGSRPSPNNNNQGNRLSPNNSSALSSPSSNRSELNSRSAPSSSNKPSRSKTLNRNEPSNPSELSSQGNKRSHSSKTPSNGNPAGRIETTRLLSDPPSRRRAGSNKTDGASTVAGKVAPASSSPGRQTGPGIIAVGASAEATAATTSRRTGSVSISGLETSFASAHSLISWADTRAFNTVVTPS